MITVREANKDREFKKRSVTDEQYDQHIRNIYKVLLTRGMVGDRHLRGRPATQDILAELIETTRLSQSPAPTSALRPQVLLSTSRPRSWHWPAGACHPAGS